MTIERIRELIAKLTERRDALTAQALASESADEVRSLNDRIAEINGDISGLETDLRAAEEEAQREERQEPEAVPENAELRNAQVLETIRTNNQEEREMPTSETMEYRQAFMAYVQNGTPIPADLRAAQTTADNAPAIPLTVMNEVINTVRKRYGNLYSKVRKLSVQGGVQFPIGALQATFKWINESTVSPRQKLGELAKVSFSYHTAEIRIAQSFLSSIVTIDAFEAKIAECIAIAYLQAMDLAIVSGSGEGAPLGILNDTRIAAANKITLTAADLSDWTAWRKKFFAKLPLGYRAGEFIFPLSTVETYLETMSDANGNPVFRQATGLEVNDGDARNPNGRFFGREISLVEPDVLPDFDAASAGDVIGIFWQPEEYAINENFGFTMRRYFDEESNEWVDKAIVIVDGKILNPTGFYLLKKGS